MSWTVDGHLYHNYADYQRALSQRDAALAERRLREKEAEAARLQQRLHEREREVAGVRGDLQRQAQAVAAVDRDLGALRRTQQELAAIQRDSEQRLGERLAEVGASQRATAAELAALQRQHAEDQRRIEQTFTAVSERIAAVAVDAERQRAAMETRLQQAIGEVDAKIEADRAARLAEVRDAAARARVQIDLVQQALTSLGERLGPLALDEEAIAVREHLHQATTLCERGDAASALAAGHGAFAEVRTLQRRALRREAELRAAREGALARLEALTPRVAAAPVQQYFAVEAQRIAALSRRLRERVAQSYARYERLSVEAARDEDMLDRAEAEVDIMAAACDGVRELLAQRTHQTQTVLRQLTQVYGPVSTVNQRFQNPEDRKSPLVVECDFGGARVNFTCQLDGSFQLDGYGHPSNSACAGRAAEVFATMRETVSVAQPRVDTFNRTEARQQAAVADSRWQQVGSRISELEGKL